MSRTHKDRHHKLRFPEENDDILIGPWRWLKLPGVKTKKKRNCHTMWNWVYSTPSNWTRIMMTRPQRRKCRLWERAVLFQDIEEADCPYFDKKPHQYYW